MKTYFIALTCFIPDESEEGDYYAELFVSVVAESPEQLEAPLRALITQEQPRWGYTTVWFTGIYEAPTKGSRVLFERTSEMGSDVRGKGSSRIEPAWFLALCTPYTRKENRDAHALRTEMAALHKAPPPEWDGKESLGMYVDAFITFPELGRVKEANYSWVKALWE